MAAPRFSVVIAAFEAERTVASAVNSALAQTRTDLEVIVVDDGSSDRTAAVVGQITDHRVQLLRQANAGPSAARNVGISATRGDYVAFLDSDDLWLPRYLELMGAALDGAENPGFAYTEAYAFDPISGRVRAKPPTPNAPPPSPPPADWKVFLLELLARNFVYNSTTVPRRVLDQVGGFDESQIRSEDYELWLRIVTAGYCPVWVPEKQALYRLHGAQASANKVGMYGGDLATWSKMSRLKMPTDAHREVLLRRQREAERQLRVFSGADRLGWMRWKLRSRARRMPEWIGLGHERWLAHSPPEVARAFPDLTSV
jgi:glycosyltransferase involved in cell wall biosynthesis